MYTLTNYKFQKLVFGLPPDIVGAAMGNIGVVEVAGLEALIPDNVALGTEDCLNLGLVISKEAKVHAALQIRLMSFLETLKVCERLRSSSASLKQFIELRLKLGKRDENMSAVKIREINET